MEKVTSEYAKELLSNTVQLSRSVKFKDIKNQIINQTDFLPEIATIRQRLWHIIYDVSEIPSCKMCDNKVSWDTRYHRYKTYCGNRSCYGSDPDVIRKKQQTTNKELSIKKRQQTCLQKYGHTNFLASEKGKQLVKQRFNQMTADEKRIRYQKVKQTRRNTMRKKYGVDNISLLNLTNSSSLLLNDKDWLKHQHHILKKSQSQIATELNVKSGATIIGKRLRQFDIEVLNPLSRSVGEQQICEFLIKCGVNIETNTRRIIPPLELDIFIPAHNLAIEYCGLYWHSEQQGKNRNYHRQKYERCKDQNIRLLTIYEDEWMERRDIVQATLKYILHINENNSPIVYARNTKISLISSQDKRDFFNNYHIQGDGPGSINIGLMYENRLVACMSFIKQQNHLFYLNRYATSTRVVGGFSKLLEYFKHNYKWTKIVSFADLRWSEGELYQKTGWNLDAILPPDYYYSPDGHHRSHKFNYRRKFLSERLSSFDPTLSERENCDRNGILRIWDCGKLRFVLSNTQRDL